GRGLVVRPRVPEAGGERDLRVAMLVDVDQRRLAAQRLAPVGADGERRGERAAFPERDRDMIGVNRDAERLVLDQGQVGQRAGALRQRLDQHAVLDVPAEGLEVDLVGVELHLRRPPQPAGIVDDAQVPQRRRLLAAERPDAERLQRGDGTREQRGGAVVAPRRRLAGERGRNAGRGKRDRRGQPGRAAADHDRLEFPFVRRQSRRPVCGVPTSTSGRPYAMHAGGMTQTTDHPAHPLAALFARPKPIAVACVVALAALGWLYLALAVAGMGGTPLGPGMGLIDGLPRAVQALCRPLFGEAAPAHGVALIALMWAAMILAMMLPTAGPMILTYAEIADTAAKKGERIVSPLVIAAGYMSVWLGFAAAATLAQIAFTRLALMDTGMTSASVLFSGAIFI